MNKYELFGLSIDRVSMWETVEIIARWLDEEYSRFRYVVTPNLDHLVKLQDTPKFREAYECASLVVPDGWPLVLAAKVFGDEPKGVVPGSDLVPAVLGQMNRTRSKERPLRVYLLGADASSLVLAKAAIEAQWANCEVCGFASPPMNFDRSWDERSFAEEIKSVGTELLLLGFGAPKQEIWAARFGANSGAKVALCVGATIEFLAGTRRRAPRVIRTLRLEWAYRMLQEPRRLFMRYVQCARLYPSLVRAEAMKRRRI